MKLYQIGKRVLLFLLVNILVVLTIGLVAELLGVSKLLPHGRLTPLIIFSFLWGFSGALISLALSRLMAKWMMGVQVIPSDTRDPELRELLFMVRELAQQAKLPAMPEVGIYESPEANAFATGPTKSRSLVAVSTGLLRRMNSDEVKGVLAHEISHIANGDMVTLTLIQGVINAFVIFLSRVLAFALGQALRSRDDRDTTPWFLQYLFIVIFETIFSLLGAIVVCWFSRWREFRADFGGAKLAGRERMISALQALKQLYDPEVAMNESRQGQAFQAFKISGKPSGFLKLFATHPPLDERIARLEEMNL